MLPVETEPLETEAEYQLESPTCCPGCRAAVERVHVVRLLRVKVNFTSSLPRRGYVVVCPDCRAMLAATIGGHLGL